MGTPMDRRALLRAAGVTAGAASLAAFLPGAPATAASPYFQHGVASGDPLPDGILLWTRVTPAAEARPGSGLGPNAEVEWQLAADPGFKTIKLSGVQKTGPDRDHTVKADVRGLDPATTYYYRFGFDGQWSPVGRTRTAPAADADVARLRLAVASCANWEGGYFAAYRHMAEDTSLDMVLFLGDYIYEYERGKYGVHQKTKKRQFWNPELMDERFHEPKQEIYSLADYRIRHAQYKTDPDLQAAHRALPWFCTWDDHEIADNAWSGGSTGSAGWPGTPPEKWHGRIQAARQAYAEWMPVRAIWDQPLYRSMQWGRLADIALLDLRSYRTKPVDKPAQAGGPDGTITGQAQMEWLERALTGSKEAGRRWRVIGNPLVMAPLFVPLTNLPGIKQVLGALQLNSGIGTAPALDQWDGYTYDRARLLGHLHDKKIGNTVFVTGDVHTSWAFDLPLDMKRPADTVVASEFVVPSITADSGLDVAYASVGGGYEVLHGAIGVAPTLFKQSNPHLWWADLAHHGFGVLTVDKDRVTHSWKFIENREYRDSPLKTGAEYWVKSGTPGLRRP